MTNDNDNGNGRGDVVMLTDDALQYLKISRPTYIKYLKEGRIKGAQVGRRWRVLKSELDNWLRGQEDIRLKKDRASVEYLRQFFASLDEREKAGPKEV